MIIPCVGYASVTIFMDNIYILQCIFMDKIYILQCKSIFWMVDWKSVMYKLFGSDMDCNKKKISYCSISSLNKSICCCSTVNKHLIWLAWHLVHKLQGNLVEVHHQNGCICKLVAILRGQPDFSVNANLLVRALKGPWALSRNPENTHLLLNRRALFPFSKSGKDMWFLSSRLLNFIMEHLQLCVLEDESFISIHIVAGLCPQPKQNSLSEHKLMGLGRIH